MLVRDALLAYAHFISIFFLASMLVGELLVWRRTLPADFFVRLQWIDRLYGISAGVVIVTGLLRLWLGPKGAAFYVHNPVFMTKIGLFVIVALLSIAPTVAIVKLASRRGPDGSVAIDIAQFGRIRALLWAQVGIFVFIPLCATFMSRGL